MQRPVISIDIPSSSFAVFDGLNIVGEFTKFTTLLEAVTSGRAVVAAKTDKKPEIVFPQVYRITTVREDGRRHSHRPPENVPTDEPPLWMRHILPATRVLFGITAQEAQFVTFLTGCIVRLTDGKETWDAHVGEVHPAKTPTS